MMFKAAYYRTILWVFIFSVAMGLLEAAVVIYLRRIYYPEGFCFPLKDMEMPILIIELLREAATLAMLAMIGLLAGRRLTSSFAYFIFAFAIWDIFYYVFLYVFTGWPESFLTWDLLFLIPSIWTGPVLAPIITSLTMILLCMVILQVELRWETAHLKSLEWVILVTGAAVVLQSYIWDYNKYIFDQYSLQELFNNLSGKSLRDYTLAYVPRNFPWLVFIIGEALILLATAMYFRRNIKH
jgi:hypothetical protein